MALRDFFYDRNTVAAFEKRVDSGQQLTDPAQRLLTYQALSNGLTNNKFLHNNTASRLFNVSRVVGPGSAFVGFGLLCLGFSLGVPYLASVALVLCSFNLFVMHHNSVVQLQREINRRLAQEVATAQSAPRPTTAVSPIQS